MKKGKTLILILIVIIIGGISTYRLFGSQKQKTLAGKSGKVKVAQTETPVKVTPVKIGEIDYTIQVNGDILPMMQVDIKPKISGYVENLNYKEGDLAKANQIIAILEHKDLQLKVRQAEAAVAVMKAKLAEIKAGARPEELRQAEEALRQVQERYQNARINLDRVRELFRKELIAKKDLDDAELAYSLADAQRISAQNQLQLVREGARTEVRDQIEAQLRQTEESLALEKYNLANSTIYAPFNGLITKRYIDPGAFVNSSIALVNLINIDTVKIIVDVMEKDISLVKIGTRVKVNVDAYTEKSFDGFISIINPAVNITTRTLPVQINIPNPNYLLKPGMFARAEIQLQKKNNVLLIPNMAIIEEDGNKYVFIVENNRADRKSIKTGLSKDEMVEILQGLKKDDNVITIGHQNLKDRAQISVISVIKEGEKE